MDSWWDFWGPDTGVWTPPVVSVGDPVRVVKTPPVAEPLTLPEAKLRAGLDWLDGDPRDAQMNDFIAAARAYVERRIDSAIPAQTHTLYYDGAAISIGAVLQLPTLPLVSVETIASTDTANVETVLDPVAYTVQRGPGIITFVGPLPSDVRTYEGWRVAVTVGTDIADLDPELVQVVGLLLAHYATAGRDLVTLGGSRVGAVEIPQGFEAALAPFVPQEIP
jgi:uncharacterized phiE125 gp8 family phage protein